MNHINRHRLIVSLLATCCFCSTTLLGGLDNIWYTYQLFFAKKIQPDAQKKEAASLSQEPSSQKNDFQVVTYPLLSWRQIATIHGLVGVELDVPRRIYDMAPRFDFVKAKKEAYEEARADIEKSIAQHTAVESSAIAEEKEQNPPIDDRNKAAAIQKLACTKLHKKIAQHIGLPLAKDDKSKDPEKKAAKQPDDMAIARLVHTIFHRPDPTLFSSVDFVITDSLRNCTKETIAEFVGRLVAAIEQGIGGHAGWEKAQFSTKTINVWIKSLDEKILKADTLTQLAAQENKEAAIEKAVSYSKMTLHNVVNFAIESCKKEYLEKSPFPPETVYLILLGLLYQHTGLDHQSLRTYYTALAKRYSKMDGIIVEFNKYVPLTATNNPERSLRFPTTPSDIAKLRNNILKRSASFIRQSASPTGITDEAITFIQKNYEEIVFLSLLPGVLPPDIRYDYSFLTTFDAATQTFTKTDKRFTDCVDGIIHNILNVLAFDQKTQRYSLTTLTTRLTTQAMDEAKKVDAEKKEADAKTASATTLSINPAISAFYQQYPSPQERGPDDPVSNSYPHSDFSAAITDIPFVAYAQNTAQKNYEYWPGYINIPETDIKAVPSLDKFIKAQGYASVEEKGAVSFEMQPSLRNIIIVFDYLLNLNLFKGNLATAFVSPYFVKTYLPKLCQALNLELDTKQSTPLNDIDKFDLSGEEHVVVIKIPHKPAMFRIKLSAGHGDYKMLGSKYGFNLPLLQKALTKENSLPLSALFFHNGKTSNICKLKSPQKMYLALFAAEIDNPEEALELSESSCLLISEDITNLLLYCVSRHPDIARQRACKLSIYTTYCRRTPDAELSKNICTQASNLATQILTNPTAFTRDLIESASKLLDVLASRKPDKKLITDFIESLVQSKIAIPDQIFGRKNLLHSLVSEKSSLTALIDTVNAHEKQAQALVHKLALYNTYCSITPDNAIDEEIFKQAMATMQIVSKAYANKESFVPYPIESRVLDLLITLASGKRHIASFTSFFIPFTASTTIRIADAPLFLYSSVLTSIILNNLKKVEPTTIMQIAQATITLLKNANLEEKTSQEEGTESDNEDRTTDEKGPLYQQYHSWLNILYQRSLEFLQTIVQADFQDIYEDTLNIAFALQKSKDKSVSNAADLLLAALITQRYKVKELGEQLLDQKSPLYTHIFTLQADGSYTEGALYVISSLIKQDCNTKQITDTLIKNLYRDDLPYTHIFSPAFSPFQDQPVTDEPTRERLVPINTLFEVKNAYAYKEAANAAQKLWSGNNIKASAQKETKREAAALLELLFTYGQNLEDGFVFISTQLADINAALTKLQTSSAMEPASKVADLKYARELLIKLLTTLVQKEFGKSTGYAQILKLLPDLLEPRTGKAVIELCAELRKQGCTIQNVEDDIPNIGIPRGTPHQAVKVRAERKQSAQVTPPHAKTETKEQVAASAKAPARPIQPQPQQISASDSQESWVCPRCDTENKPPLPGQRAVCIECKTPQE